MRALSTGRRSSPSRGRSAASALLLAGRGVAGFLHRGGAEEGGPGRRGAADRLLVPPVTQGGAWAARRLRSSSPDREQRSPARPILGGGAPRCSRRPTSKRGERAHVGLRSCRAARGFSSSSGRERTFRTRKVESRRLDSREPKLRVRPPGRLLRPVRAARPSHVRPRRVGPRRSFDPRTLERPARLRPSRRRPVADVDRDAVLRGAAEPVCSRTPRRTWNRIDGHVGLGGPRGPEEPLPLPPGNYSYPCSRPTGGPSRWSRWEGRGRASTLTTSRETCSRLFFPSRAVPSIRPGRPTAGGSYSRVFETGCPRLYWKAADGSGAPEADPDRAEDAGVSRSGLARRHARSLTLRFSASSGTRTSGFSLWTARGSVGLVRDTLQGVRRPSSLRTAAASPTRRRVGAKTRSTFGPYPGPGGRIKIRATAAASRSGRADGSEIFYRTGERLIVELSAEGDPILRRAPHSSLSGRYQTREDDPREYDVSPDGNSFVVIEQTSVAGDDDAAPRLSAVASADRFPA